MDDVILEQSLNMITMRKFIVVSCFMFQLLITMQSNPNPSFYFIYVLPIVGDRHIQKIEAQSQGQDLSKHCSRD